MNLRRHNCRIRVDHDRKVLYVRPDSGHTVVLTTAALYAWSVHHLGTEEGIRIGRIVDIAGYMGSDLALRIASGYRIHFYGAESAFLYGVVLASDKGGLKITRESNVKFLFGSPFASEHATLFISHSSVDKPLVRTIVDDLDLHYGIFIDEKDIRIGDSIATELNRGLERADGVVLFASKSSIESKWVQREYAYALHEGKPIFPILVGDIEPPPLLRDIKWIRYRAQDHQALLRELFESLEKTFGRQEQL